MSEHQDNAKLLVGIESCRPGSDDCDLPEMADVAQMLAEDDDARALFESVQQSDAVIGAAFQSGPVPEGLQDRLLAALDVAEEEDREAPAENAPRPPATDAGSPAQKTDRRRWAWMLAAAATLLIAVGVVAFVAFSDNEPLTVAEVLDGASAAEESINQGLDAWTLTSDRKPHYPPSDRLLKTPTQWQAAPCLGDRQGVAYRIPISRRDRSNKQGTLLVFRPTSVVTDLPAAPPGTPQGGRASSKLRAAWAEDGVVFVLILDAGDAHLYPSLVKAARVVAVTRPQSLPSRHQG